MEPTDVARGVRPNRALVLDMEGHYDKDNKRCQIRMLVDNWAKAVRARDMGSVLTNHTDDFETGRRERKERHYDKSQMHSGREPSRGDESHVAEGQSRRDLRRWGGGGKSDLRHVRGLAGA